MPQQIRYMYADGDPGAVGDQIRAAVTEMRATNPPAAQVAIEAVATRLRANLEKIASEVGVPFPAARTIIIGLQGTLNALTLRLNPDAASDLSCMQSVLIVALYGQPGD